MALEAATEICANRAGTYFQHRRDNPMSTPNTTPAFPSTTTDRSYPDCERIELGMSKRFYAAVHILAAALSVVTHDSLSITEEDIAQDSFLIADALIKAEQENQP